MSKSRGQTYFFNTETGESVWEKPTGPAAATQGHSQKPQQVRASHLLVKHNKSRRPSSWKEENITRSKEEALVILRGLVVFHIPAFLSILPTPCVAAGS